MITAGPDQGRNVPLDRELVIGREDADVLLSDPEVSRRHAVVRPVERGVEIEDLGSANGTFINGERISDKVVVGERATLKLGATQFAVELPTGTGADAEAAPDTRSPEVKARQEAVTHLRDVPPEPPPPAAGRSGPPSRRPRGAGAGPPGGRMPPPLRLLMKTPLGKLIRRRRMARMADRQGPPGSPQR